MRSALNIDDAILGKAGELTGVKERTALVRMGLEALIARESAWQSFSSRAKSSAIPPSSVS